MIAEDVKSYVLLEPLTWRLKEMSDFLNFGNQSMKKIFDFFCPKIEDFEGFLEAKQ
jgi:hypothetical protein